MRTRAILPALILALATGASAFGCQYFAGLTVLEITPGHDGGTDGSGGGGGSGPAKALGEACSTPGECGAHFCTDGVCCDVAACSSANDCRSCAAVAGGTCQPASLGTSCGDPTETACNHKDTCDGAGTCQPHLEVSGVACGSSATTECSAPDTCDGSGNCLSNDAASGTLCGDKVGNACASPDACDGAGACAHHYLPATTVCGGTCVGASGTAAGTCNGAGTCGGAPFTCPAHYGCDTAGTTCNSGMCASSAECAAGSVCSPTSAAGPTCTACGSAPGPMTCLADPTHGCETCAGNTCVRTCDTSGECAGNVVVGGMVPARIDCGDQCNDTIITCVGANPCEIVCAGTGCQGLTIDCSTHGGNCTLTCTGSGCQGSGVTMSCGDNQCTADCSGATAGKVAQVANDACGVTQTGCQ